MNTVAEACLQAVILPDLEHGRLNWDRPHTELVVMYTKEIIAATTDVELDEEVLVPAAYGHDWGYIGLFEDRPPKDLATIRAQKAEHMIRGAEMMADLLQRPEFDCLTDTQKLRICDLILWHDDIEALEDEDELVLMEADTLASLDGTGTDSLFSPEEKSHWQRKALRRRVPLFITEYSRVKLQELMARNGSEI